MAKKFYRFINSKDKNDFLNYYIQCGTISKAAKKAGITRQTHYNWLKDDKKGFYRKAFELADKMAADLLEEEAFRRAVEGDLQVVFYKGEEVGRRRVYSDQLLSLLLKGKKPQYRENTEINNNISVELSDAVSAAQTRVKKGEGKDGSEE
jgi:protease II